MVVAKPKWCISAVSVASGLGHPEGGSRGTRALLSGTPTVGQCHDGWTRFAVHG